ncbi:MAG: MBG domain-containing protein, partial [Coriobacteriales bacterium]|nr:MBG domain-containing protein [Coriobacteriales bacterium]
NDAAKTYRAADPTFTATVEGLVEPDTEAIISYEFTREAGANVGTYAITPSGDEVQGNYRLTFVPGTLTIKPRSIAKATIVSIAAKTYTGSALKPKLTVKDGTKTLVLNTDYTVTYKDNVKKGTATVTIKGKGNYSGSTSTTFKINAASVAKATVSKIANQKYDGNEKKPRPTVKVGTRTLKLGTDYTLTYKNNQKAGTATVTIKGKGNYTGSKSVTFKIVVMAGTWKGSGSKWWYQWKDGKYPKSVFLDISGKTYYFDASGYCVYGWKKIGGKDYYFESSGAMAKNKWVGNYYLGADGAMLVNTVTPDGWRVDKNGKAVKKVA